MLTENGAFIFIGAINQTYYSVGEVKFKSTKMSKNYIYQVYRKHGLVIELFKEFQNEQLWLFDGYLYLAVARKTAE